MAGSGHDRRTDADTLLDLVGDVCGLLDIDELRHGLLAALHRALPSAWVSLNEIVTADPDRIVTISVPEATPEMLAVWARLAHENPLLRFYRSTLDGRAYRFSDVIDSRALQRLAIYRELYAPRGLKHQMAFTLPAGSDRVLAIALSRGERDYSDAERDLANRARPFLIQAYLNAVAFSSLRTARAPRHGGPDLAALRAAGLTCREAEVLRLLALGNSNQRIAAQLGISHRTVGKHLEHVFRKLRVGDRSSAAARAWELAAGGAVAAPA
jgi:DNA-binding CsgD family transcriptional regulator